MWVFWVLVSAAQEDSAIRIRLAMHLGTLSDTGVMRVVQYAYHAKPERAQIASSLTVSSVGLPYKPFDWYKKALLLHRRTCAKAGRTEIYYCKFATVRCF